MTFDPNAACGNCTNDCGQCKWRPALDEIERLQKKDMHDCISCRAEAYQEGAASQAKRIAELEDNQCYSGSCSYAVNYEEDMTTYRIKIDKQRAALKKLGHKYHERGDDIAGLKSKAGMLQAALVEERAKRCSLIDMHVAPRVTNEFKIQPRYMRSLARQQLRAEGKL